MENFTSKGYIRDMQDTLKRSNTPVTVTLEWQQRHNGIKTIFEKIIPKIPNPMKDNW